jgi:type VI secretion system protein ImpA
MPTPSLLSFDEVLAAIPGEDPAGDTVPFTVRQKLEEFRKEINPADFDPDDPLRPDQKKAADWPAVQRLAVETLTGSSKDLLVAARLTEALTKQYGFAGLRDGLHLMKRLVNDCWDRINPKIEDGDIEVRAGPFNWLADADRGARFPGTLRSIPLASSGDQHFGWQQWKLIQDGKSPVGADVFEQAIMATPAEACRTQLEDIDQAFAEFNELSDILTAKMESSAPEMFALKQALEQCQTLAKQLLERKGGAAEAGEAIPEAEAEAEAAAPEPGGDGAEAAAAGLARRARTRSDIYRQLHELATVLQQMEPHSPIPYLILRACELGALPFPQLMRSLIRDPNILTEMNRELGIHEAPPPAEAQPEE